MFITGEGGHLLSGGDGHIEKVGTQLLVYSQKSKQCRVSSILLVKKYMDTCKQ